MADTSNYTPTPADNTPEWLKEVKADAEFNYKRLLREQKEKAAHEASKAEQKNK